ncbi:Mu transposase C-terminal domain-containing protein [Cellulomonas sp. Leaf334]|uniref:Mu transposase C-terminal domain-containing protein n=1 Tax=Cellulomonas sp. Leaf334 TaxID=1736339 RepID=UPI0006F2ED94|nr:Mu transposase C-terminal domain-containing protein [Cellulomonas sp. Leaf334]KQR17268.1 hypothetical protein ASF78_08210 [Cellulomonas sp. Leaf334]
MNDEAIALRPGTRFSEGAGVTYLGIEFHGDQPYAVLERDGSHDLVPYDEAMPELQEAVPTPPRGPYWDFIRDPKFPLLEEVEQHRLRVTAAHMLEVLHGDPGGMLHAPREDHVPRPEYDPALTNSLNERIHNKVEELKKNPDKSLPHWVPKYWHPKLKDFCRDGIECLIPADKLNELDIVARASREMMPVARALAEELAQRHQPDSSLRFQIAMFRSRLDVAGISAPDGFPESGYTRLWKIARAGKGLDGTARARENRLSSPKEQMWKQYTATRPGELIQCDLTRIDVYGTSQVAPWFSMECVTLIDVYDKFVLCAMLVPLPATARDVCVAFFRALNAAPPALAPPPGIPRYWHGVPAAIALPEVTPNSKSGRPIVLPGPRAIQTIAMDRGALEDNFYISSLATRLGIHSLFCAPGKGHQKGNVESWHRTLSSWTPAFPGAKGGRPEHRGKDAEKFAGRTMRQLQLDLDRRIIHQYNYAPHGGLPDEESPGELLCPAEKYRRFVRYGGAPSVLRNPLTIFDFLPRVTIRASEKGIELNHNRYDGEALMRLKDHQRGPIGPDLVVMFDPYDPTRVYVEDPWTGRVYMVWTYRKEVRSAVPFEQAIARRAAGDPEPNLTVSQKQKDQALSLLLGQEYVEAPKRDRKFEERLGLAFHRYIRANMDGLDTGLFEQAIDLDGDGWYVDPDNFEEDAEDDFIGQELDRIEGRPAWEQ